MKSFLLSSLSVVFIAVAGFAQCNTGEIALTMNIAVDGWGQETYWELVPVGNGCGNGTLAFGSNTNVGCDGIAPQDDSGYPDNTTVSEGPFCLVEGTQYDIVFVDSYGDGGLVFELFEDGNFSHAYAGSGHGNTWTFEAGNSGLPANDSPCGASEIIPDGAAVEMTNTTAVAQLSEPHPGPGGCGIYGFWCNSDANATNTVWAYFVAAAETAYEITTCNEGAGFDTQLALYHATDCSSFETFELVSSNDDMQGGCAVANGFSSKMYASCLIAGDTYYIQMDGWAGALGTANLTISTYQGNTEFNAEANNIACPLDKGATPTGSIIPYFVGEGIDFTAEWTGPNNFSSSENYIYNLAPGTYNLSITSGCGEHFDGSYFISQPSAWGVVITGEGPDCEESDNGTINLAVNGATAPYGFVWGGPDNYVSEAEDITNLEGGSYIITITDNNGCQYSQPYELQVANSFSFDLGNDTTICLNDQIIVYAPSGNTYLWQDESQNQFYVVEGMEWGTGDHALILTATTGDGCSYTDAYVFTVEDCSSVEENNRTVLQIYPNPVEDRMMIKLNRNSNHTDVVIHDAAGRVVESFMNLSGSVFSFDLDLAAGLYSVSIRSDDEQWVEQMIVND